jgi:hypothetical protein
MVVMKARQDFFKIKLWLGNKWLPARSSPLEATKFRNQTPWENGNDIRS